MRVLREPEHVELCLVPTTDNVEAEAAPTDVIGRDDLLGREHRRKNRYMHGTKHGQALGGGEQAARPCDGLKRAALKISRTAIALPAPDRHHGFEAGGVGQLSEPDIVLEGVLPALRHRGRGAAARTVGAEDGKLEPVATKYGGIALDLHDVALTPPPAHVACPEACIPGYPCWPYSSPAYAVCPALAALASRRCAWGLEPHPCQALSFLARETAVHDHDHHPLRPGLLEVRRHRESLASSDCRCRPDLHRQHPRRPRLVDVF